MYAWILCILSFLYCRFLIMSRACNTDTGVVCNTICLSFKSWKVYLVCEKCWLYDTEEHILYINLLWKPLKSFYVSFIICNFHKFLYSEAVFNISCKAYRRTYKKMQCKYILYSTVRKHTWQHTMFHSWRISLKSFWCLSYDLPFSQFSILWYFFYSYK